MSWPGQGETVLRSGTLGVLCVGVIALLGEWEPRRQAVRDWGRDPEDEDVVLVDTDGDAFAAAEGVDPGD